MKILKYFNCIQEEIKSRKFNIFIGISLGNKYFSEKNLSEYLKWALTYTKHSVLFVIADQNHAVNYEVFNNYSHQKSLRHATLHGDKIHVRVSAIIEKLSEVDRERVHIVRWDRLRKDSYYKAKRPLVQKEFDSNHDFRKYILNAVSENLGQRIIGLNISKINKLAEYILDEIPVLINSIRYNSELFNLYPYPSHGLYDDLIEKLQNKSIFNELAEKLEINSPCAVVTAIVD